jgi:hypothetical protein
MVSFIVLWVWVPQVEEKGRYNTATSLWQANTHVGRENTLHDFHPYMVASGVYFTP